MPIFIGYSHKDAQFVDEWAHQEQPQPVPSDTDDGARRCVAIAKALPILPDPGSDGR